MITIASLFVFLAFYTLYYTSKKATLVYNSGYEKWMQKNPKETKITGMVLLIIAYFIWLLNTALEIGTFLFFIQLMTIGSLIIILAPLKIIGSKGILALFIFAILIEIFL